MSSTSLTFQNVLWYLTLIAGISYIIVHFLKLINSKLAFENTLDMILALSMTIGEVGLAIWLLVKGGKVNKLKKKPAANGLN